MIPLIDKDEFRKLLRIRDAMIDEGVLNVGNVFVPVGPDLEDPEPVPFRILFVGAALLREKHDPTLDEYEEAVSWSIAVIQKLLIRPVNAPFWSFVKEIVRRSLLAIGDGRASSDMDEVLLKVVAWSNLAKISADNGNPKGKVLERQAGLCVKLLKSEIERAKPDVIIVAVSNYAEKEIAEPIFGKDGWGDHDTLNGIKLDHPTIRIPIVFTPVPRNMGNSGNLEKSRDSCVDVVVKSVIENKQ